MADAVCDGAKPIGERCSQSKITEQDVRMAREDRALGMTYQALGERYGITKGAIWHAVNGTQWSHVK